MCRYAITSVLYANKRMPIIRSSSSFNLISVSVIFGLHCSDGDVMPLNRIGVEIK